MNNLERLIAIEAIRELKARHCRLADYAQQYFLRAAERARYRKNGTAMLALHLPNATSVRHPKANQ